MNLLPYAILCHSYTFLRKIVTFCTNIAIQEKIQWLQLPEGVAIPPQVLQLLCPSIQLLQFQTQLSLLLLQLRDRFFQHNSQRYNIGQRSLLTWESDERKVDNQKRKQFTYQPSPN
jgi:hypothetical protein